MEKQFTSEIIHSLDHLDACYAALQSIALDGTEGTQAKAVLLMECYSVCRNHLYDRRFGKRICELCAEVADACSAGDCAVDSLYVKERYQKLLHYINVSKH